MMKTQARLEGRGLCSVRGEGRYDLPPDVLFELLADPCNHLHIFDAIEGCDCELLEAHGARRKWRLDYRTRWQFWKVSGVCDSRLHMWSDSEAGTVTFKLREPGFLKVYEGKWTIKPEAGSAGAQLNPLKPGLALPLAATSSSSSSGSGSSSSNNTAARTTNTTSSSSSSSSSSSAVPMTRQGSGGRARVPLPAANTPLPAAPAAALAVPAGAGGAALCPAPRQQPAAPLSRQGSSGSRLARANSGGAPMPAASIGAALEGLMQGTAAAAGAVAGRLGQLQVSAGPKAAAAAPAAVLARALSCSVVIEKTMSPKLQPPYPLSLALKSQASRQVQDMAAGLVAAAKRTMAGQPLQEATASKQ